MKLDGLKMQELRKLAKERGINSFGMKKVDLKKAIQDKEQAEDFEIASDEEIKEYIAKDMPSIKNTKVQSDIKRRHRVRNKPVKQPLKQELQAKYDEKFVSRGRVPRFLEMGYKPAKVDLEKSGFSLPNDGRYKYLEDALNGSLIYMIRKK